MIKNTGAQIDPVCSLELNVDTIQKKKKTVKKNIYTYFL